MNISNQFSKLFGITKTPEMAHNVMVRLILTLKIFISNLKKGSIK